jgi:hypothetical protein
VRVSTASRIFHRDAVWIARYSARKKKRRLSETIVTPHDVAKRAGVSPMTVSRHIGGKRAMGASLEAAGMLPVPS